jgi:hypothetical protein
MAWPGYPTNSGEQFSLSMKNTEHGYIRRCGDARAGLYPDPTWQNSPFNRFIENAMA